MISNPVPLERHFSPVPKTKEESDRQEILEFWDRGDRKGWLEIEQEYRCVIIAAAGAGKTFEMEARAQRLFSQGHAAFFIRIEDVAEGFETAFEVGDAVSFDHWLTSTDEAWFFLDSVDEARLDSPKAFEKAIRRFSTRIKKAQQRARVFVSSRPYAWRPQSDRALLEKHLPFEKPIEEPNGNADPIDEVLASDVPDRSESALQVFLLNDLDERDVRLFAAHRGVPDSDKLILELQRTDLMEMASRPFDLEVILDKWIKDQALDGRLELLRHSIDRRLRENDPNRNLLQPLNHDKARAGARTLAAAIVLTGEAGLHVPDETPIRSGIDAEMVLADWDTKDIQALLERGIFNDAIYGMVRFRHREVRELLAAEWIYEHLRKGNSRRKVETLLFREQYGQKVVAPRLRPLLPWLILFDDGIRARVRAINPEIAVEGGDASRLPLAERQSLLRDIVERIVNDEDDGSGRDNSAIARIAQADLSDDALRLIAEHMNNDEAIFFLGRLVWQGEMTKCVPSLSGIATEPNRGIYARIAAARAVMTCGTPEQKDGLWRSLNALPDDLPRKLLAEIVEDAAADARSVVWLLALIDKLPPYERYEVSGLTEALHDFIDRLPITALDSKTAPLLMLVSGLNALLDREPHIEGLGKYVSKEFCWLIGPAAHAVDRLVSARVDSALELSALEIMRKASMARFWRLKGSGNHKSDLANLIPSWSKLNDELFWYSVKKTRNFRLENESESQDDFFPLQWFGAFWQFTLDDFDRVLDFVKNRVSEDDKLVAVSLACWLMVQFSWPPSLLADLRQTVDGNPVLEDRLETRLKAALSARVNECADEEEEETQEWDLEQQNRANDRAQWIERLRAEPDIIRSPPGLEPGQISNSQYSLLKEIEGSGPQTRRRKGANWQYLREDFGEAVAQAYRSATKAHWRSYTPGLRSEETDANVDPANLRFAIVGLEIEAREVKNFPDHLSNEELRQALRYMTWELNGFPTLFETIYRAHPDLVLESVLNEVRWELANAVAGEPMYHFLHDLVYHAPWLHAALVDPLLASINAIKVRNHDTLRYALRILKGGKAEAERLAGLARRKVDADVESLHLPTWYALWVDTDPESGIAAAERWLDSQEVEEALQSAQLFSTALIGERRGAQTGPNVGKFLTARHLKALYVLMHCHIQTKDDIERANKGAYSPELRDHAQRARNKLFNLLHEIPGKETYIALTELTRDHPDPTYRPRMAMLARKHAEADADLEPWTADQVHEFDKGQTRTPKTHRQLFELGTHRLTDLKSDIELGVYSPYKTWQKASDEPEMRNLVAGWLNAQSGSRYSCAQEAEQANKQKPDIWIQNPDIPTPVPIELKLLDQGWTGPKLCERLRNQLAGDYLREETAGCGIMLLIWQGRSARKHWQISDRRVAISDLREAMLRYWGSISDQFPGVAAIDVIVIDLTTRGKKSDA